MHGYKLLILDDHRLFIEGLKLVLLGLPEIARVDTALSAQSLLADAEALRSYDLILIDLQMPGIDGHSFLRAMIERKLMVRVAVLSGEQSLQQIEKAMGLGACGFVPKSAAAIELQSAVRRMLSGEHYLPDEVAGRIDLDLSDTIRDLPDAAPVEIGARQMQVLELLKTGQTNKQIAMVLGISESAIKSHLSILFTALGVNTRTACVHAALETGLLE